MAKPIYDIANLNYTKVEANRKLLRAAINAYTGQYSISRGVIHDTVLELTSVLTAAIEQDIDRVRNNGSLQYAIDNPTAVSKDAVNNLLSNFRVYRLPGAPAYGQMSIILNGNKTATITKGTQFKVGDVYFKATDTFKARAGANQIQNNTDRVLTKIGTSNYYYFIVDVVCLTNGTAGNVAAGIEATYVGNKPPYFYKAFTYGRIFGGQDAESNQDLINKLFSGWSVRSWGSRVSIEGMLRNKHPLINHISVVGSGDNEMLRDTHGVFPVSRGGCTDVYLRYDTGYAVKVVTQTATLLSKSGAVGTWRVNVGKTVVPGFYDVVKVLLPSQTYAETGFTVSADTRGFDLSSEDSPPDITSGLEAAYSKYQTAQIDFVDNVTDATSLAIGATASYQVAFRYMPYIQNVQSYMLNATRKPLSSDVLVKAPIPVFCSLSFTVTLPTATTVYDRTALISSVSYQINSQGFTNKISDYSVFTGINTVIPNAKVTNVNFTGTLRKPNGTSVTLTPGSSLTVADDFANMVSSNTVVFYLPSTAITMTIVTP